MKISTRTDIPQHKIIDMIAKNILKFREGIVLKDIVINVTKTRLDLHLEISDDYDPNLIKFVHEDELKKQLESLK